jgi:twitching motility protein PilT
MAQIDQLIAFLAKHNAEALVLAAGRQPALLIGGAQRPIVKGAMEGVQITRMLAEIAPPAEYPTVVAGGEVAFHYTAEGTTVRIELARGPRATIKPDASVAATAQVALPAATAQIAPAVEAPAPKPAAPAPTGPLSINALLRLLFERGGSDLHLSSACPPILRIDGDLAPVTELHELDAAAVERLMYEVTPARNKAEFEECGDTDFAYEIPGVSRFRCNMFRDRKGPGGVFRVIPSKIPTAEQLGLPKAIQELCNLTKGLVLVTGPTGSGKSTTLAAMIDLINATRRDHIITIEDPIEFVHKNQGCLVNQREVHVHTQGFKHALRAALREDPDVVLVGEMRDLETVAIAIETAETGHLVFGTLHTTSAVSTVDRIIDQFPADRQEQVRIMLSESLKGVISQTLCRKIGGGRCAALEVLLVNPAVSNLIREGKTFQVQSIMQTQKGLGMTLLNDALLELVIKKAIEPREAYIKAIDKPNLLVAMKAKNVKCDFVEEPKRPVPQPV